MEELYVVLQPAVPMRAEASDRSEMVSQMLFGDLCQVLQKRECWYEVRTAMDQYVGWVNPKQLTKVGPADLEVLDTSFLVARDPVVSVVVDGCCQMLLPMGASVPKGSVEVCGHLYATVGGTGEESEDMASYAMRLQGAPYLWGGKTLMGIDCSGLIQVAASMVGVSLPRDASQQALVGQEVASVREALRNDLMFFSNESGRVIHVGVFLGEGRILHASGNVHIDEVDEKGIYNKNTSIYTHRLHSIRRL